MSADCTIQDHVAAESQLYRLAYADGRKAGVLEGHRQGFDVGYIAGFSEGTRSSANWKSGEASGFVTGYLERIGDELARREEVAK